MARFDQQVTFLSVADLDASVEFYGGLLGLEQVLDQGACRIFRTAPAAFLGVCTHRGDRPATEGVIVTMVTDDVDGRHAELVARGAAFQAPPAYNRRFDIYHAFLRDPDGYLVEIQEFRDPAWPVE